jgi:hypothetical protein
MFSYKKRAKREGEASEREEKSPFASAVLIKAALRARRGKNLSSNLFRFWYANEQYSTLMDS